MMSHSSITFDDFVALSAQLFESENGSNDPDQFYIFHYKLWTEMRNECSVEITFNYCLLIWKIKVLLNAKKI